MIKTYKLRDAVPAVQYSYCVNEEVVTALIRSTGRDGFSWSNATRRGFLTISNGGPPLDIEDGQWVVAVGGHVQTLSPKEFDELYVET